MRGFTLDDDIEASPARPQDEESKPPLLDASDSHDKQTIGSKLCQHPFPPSNGVDKAIEQQDPLVILQKQTARDAIKQLDSASDASTGVPDIGPEQNSSCPSAIRTKKSTPLSRLRVTYNVQSTDGEDASDPSAVNPNTYLHLVEIASPSNCIPDCILDDAPYDQVAILKPSVVECNVDLDDKAVQPSVRIQVAPDEQRQLLPMISEPTGSCYGFPPAAAACKETLPVNSNTAHLTESMQQAKPVINKTRKRVVCQAKLPFASANTAPSTPAAPDSDFQQPRTRKRGQTNRSAVGRAATANCSADAGGPYASGAAAGGASDAAQSAKSAKAPCKGRRKAPESKGSPSNAPDAHNTSTLQHISATRSTSGTVSKSKANRRKQQQPKVQSVDSPAAAPGASDAIDPKADVTQACTIPTAAAPETSPPAKGKRSYTRRAPGKRRSNTASTKSTTVLEPDVPTIAVAQQQSASQPSLHPLPHPALEQQQQAAEPENTSHLLDPLPTVEHATLHPSSLPPLPVEVPGVSIASGVMPTAPAELVDLTGPGGDDDEHDAAQVAVSAAACVTTAGHVSLSSPGHVTQSSQTNPSGGQELLAGGKQAGAAENKENVRNEGPMEVKPLHPFFTQLGKKQAKQAKEAQEVAGKPKEVDVGEKPSRRSGAGSTRRQPKRGSRDCTPQPHDGGDSNKGGSMAVDTSQTCSTSAAANDGAAGTLRDSSRTDDGPSSSSAPAKRVATIFLPVAEQKRLKREAQEAKLRAAAQQQLASEQASAPQQKEGGEEDDDVVVVHVPQQQAEAAPASKIKPLHPFFSMRTTGGGPSALADAGKVATSTTGTKEPLLRAIHVTQEATDQSAVAEPLDWTRWRLSDMWFRSRGDAASSVHSMLSALRDNGCYDVMLADALHAQRPGMLVGSDRPRVGRVGAGRDGLLWVDKYRPTCAQQMCGNSQHVMALRTWLSGCKESMLSSHTNARASALATPVPRKAAATAGKPAANVASDSESDWFQTPGGRRDSLDSDMSGRAVLSNCVCISGPVGSGKTAAVCAVSQELGFSIIEVNSGGQRGGSHVLKAVGEATQSRRLHNSGAGNGVDSRPAGIAAMLTAGAAISAKVEPKKRKSTRAGSASAADGGADGTVEQVTAHPVAAKKPRCDDTADTKDASRSAGLSVIVFEDVDQLLEEDKGFTSAVRSLMADSKCPIILLSNSPDPEILSVCPVARTFAFDRPTSAEIHATLSAMCNTEGVEVPSEDLDGIISSCRQDIRLSVMTTQFWALLDNPAALQAPLAHDEGDVAVLDAGLRRAYQCMPRFNSSAWRAGEQLQPQAAAAGVDDPHKGGEAADKQREAKALQFCQDVEEWNAQRQRIWLQVVARKWVHMEEKASKPRKRSGSKTASRSVPRKLIRHQQSNPLTNDSGCVDDSLEDAITSPQPTATRNSRRRFRLSDASLPGNCPEEHSVALPCDTTEAGSNADAGVNEQDEEAQQRETPAEVDSTDLPCDAGGSAAVVALVASDAAAEGDQQVLHAVGDQLNRSALRQPGATPPVHPIAVPSPLITSASARESIPGAESGAHAPTTSMGCENVADAAQQGAAGGSGMVDHMAMIQDGPTCGAQPGTLTAEDGGDVDLECGVRPGDSPTAEPMATLDDVDQAAAHVSGTSCADVSTEVEQGPAATLVEADAQLERSVLSMEVAGSDVAKLGLSAVQEDLEASQDNMAGVEGDDGTVEGLQRPVQQDTFGEDCGTRTHGVSDPRADSTGVEGSVDAMDDSAAGMANSDGVGHIAEGAEEREDEGKGERMMEEFQLQQLGPCPQVAKVLSYEDAVNHPDSTLMSTCALHLDYTSCCGVLAACRDVIPAAYGPLPLRLQDTFCSAKVASEALAASHEAADVPPVDNEELLLGCRNDVGDTRVPAGGLLSIAQQAALEVADLLVAGCSTASSDDVSAAQRHPTDDIAPIGSVCHVDAWDAVCCAVPYLGGSSKAAVLDRVMYMARIASLEAAKKAVPAGLNERRRRAGQQHYLGGQAMCLSDDVIADLTSLGTYAYSKS